MRRAFFLLTAFVLLLAGPLQVAATQNGSPLEKVDPLLWAPLVVRGEITQLTEEPSSFQEWGITGSISVHKLVVQTIDLRVEDIIKGSWKNDQVNVAFFKSLWGPDAQPYKIGSRVILAVYYNSNAGKLHLRNPIGLFVQDGGKWTRSSDRWQPLQDADRSMPLQQIEQRVRSTSPEAIAERAELIIVGRITAAERAESGEELSRWTLQVSEVLKGTSNAPSVDFCMVTRGSIPAWAVPVARDLQQGDTCVVFLTRRDEYWIPFAGANGMLEIDDGKVLYEGVIDIGMTWSELHNVCARS